MTGRIYLGGGGAAADEAALWRTMLAGSTRLIHWPFALARHEVPTAAAWLTASLRELALDVDVDTWTDLADHRPNQLAAADLLFVGGGNTFRLLAHVREHGFGEAVRRFVDDGGDYYGGSAGALLAGADIELASRYDENDVGMTDFTALQLVPGIEVLPHYAATEAEYAYECAAARGHVVLGIPERSGVAVGSGVAEVIGAEPVEEFSGGRAVVRLPGDSWVLGGRT